MATETHADPMRAYEPTISACVSPAGITSGDVWAIIMALGYMSVVSHPTPSRHDAHAAPSPQARIDVDIKPSAEHGTPT